MTRIAVLGASGMLGHRLMLQLSDDFETVGSVRKMSPWFESRISNPKIQVATGIDATDFASVEAFLDDFEPAVVLNCIGIVKQLADATDPVKSITINALFPHLLARSCARRNTRLIHFSTDCVFAGEDGPYPLDAVSDARDLYGRSKYLGEVAELQNTLTIRSSIIGHELANKTGLIEWILSSKGTTIQGYAGGLYTGVTTIVMAKAIARIVRDFPTLCGVRQFSSPAVSKFDLVKMVNEIYELEINVQRNDEFSCDRRLDGSVFERETGIVSGPWEEMITDQHASYLSEYRNV